MTKWTGEKLFEYIKNQRKVNTYHTNGALENDDDYSAMEDVADRIAAIDSPKSILDVGCRVGTSLDVFAEVFPAARIVGVDIVPQFIEVAKTRCREARCTARLADAHDLPFPDGSFEWVVCNATLEHAYAPELVVSELVRTAVRGIYCTADLESTASFERNVSHYHRNDDPEYWIGLFPRDGWSLRHRHNPPRHTGGSVRMIWVKDGLQTRSH